MARLAVDSRLRGPYGDAPYSTCWENYSLEGFGGNLFHREGAVAGWPEVFDHLRPVCPRCSRMLTPDNLSGN